MALIDTAKNAAGAVMRSGVERVGLFAWLLCTAFYGLPSLLFRGDRFSRRRTVEALFDTALRPLPILTVLAALTGLVLAFSISRILDFVNVESLLLQVLRIALMREAMPLLVGIFVAGRSGVALAVRIGRMAVGGETDALRLSGIDPAHYVLPANLLAFCAGAALLFMWGIAMGHFAAAMSLQQFDGIPIARYLIVVFVPAARDEFWFGLLRVETYALVTLTIAAVEGSYASRDPQMLESVARRTFVTSLLCIFGSAALFTGLGI